MWFSTNIGINFSNGLTLFTLTVIHSSSNSYTWLLIISLWIFFFSIFIEHLLFLYMAGFLDILLLRYFLGNLLVLVIGKIGGIYGCGLKM